MSQLRKRVWYSKYLSRGTNVEVFKRMVLPVLFYGCETWTLTNDLNHRLDSLGTSSLRNILGYQWFYFKSNDRFLEKTSMKNISELIFERQMSMFGHVARVFYNCDSPPGLKRGPKRQPNTWLIHMPHGGILSEVGTDREQVWALGKDEVLAYRDR